MKKILPLTALALLAAACGKPDDTKHYYYHADAAPGTVYVKPDATYYRDARGAYYLDSYGNRVYVPGDVYPAYPNATVVTPGYTVEKTVDKHHKWEDPLSERSLGSNRGPNNSVMPNQDRVEYNYVPSYTVRPAYAY